MVQIREVIPECGAINVETALKVLLVIADQEPEIYDKAATRWLGQLLSTHPALGLDRAGEVAGELEALFGHSRECARSRIALALRSVGEVRAAEVLEGG